MDKFKSCSPYCCTYDFLSTCNYFLTQLNLNEFDFSIHFCIYIENNQLIYILRLLQGYSLGS